MSIDFFGVRVTVFFNSKLVRRKGGLYIKWLKDVFVCKGFGGNAVCNYVTLRGLLRHRAVNASHAFGEVGSRCGNSTS
jgi:hypothetical protein